MHVIEVQSIVDLHFTPTYQSIHSRRNIVEVPFPMEKYNTVCLVFSGVGKVLIFQFSPGFGTEESVSTVPRYRFWYLGSGSYFWIPGFWCNVFKGLFAFFSFWFQFGSIFVPFQFQIRWNRKLWYWTLNDWNLKCSKFSVLK